MHFAQQNEFVGAYGTYSILHPLGYGTILKKIKGGAPVRSAVEQYNIHKLANGFESALLTIPKAYDLSSNDSYTMEHMIIGGTYIPSKDYKYFPTLISELNKFYGYMISHGYFPYKFTILYCPNNTFLLFDFSLFGSFSKGMVKFKHIRSPIHLMMAEHTYGLLSFLIVDEKIEEYAVEF